MFKNSNFFFIFEIFVKILKNYFFFFKKIKILDFTFFLKGFQKDEEIELILKEISKFKLINDKLGFTYFNELLYCILKRTYEPQINCGSNELAIKELEKSDEKTRLKLHIKKKKKVIFFFKFFQIFTYFS